MGKSSRINDSAVPYAVMMCCSRSCNVPRMHFIGCAGITSSCIAILTTEYTIRSYNYFAPLLQSISGCHSKCIAL